MGQIDGFLKFKRELPSSRNPEERINDSQEIYHELLIASTGVSVIF